MGKQLIILFILLLILREKGEKEDIATIVKMAERFAFLHKLWFWSFTRRRWDICEALVGMLHRGEWSS